MKSPQFLLGLTLGIILASATLAAERPPNLLLIFVDDMGYGDIGAFGCKAYATPNLDRLAREGRTFTNFHVSQPVCSASRAALLTGCYSNRIGINGALSPKVTHGLAASETTLAEILKARGYATGMAGKWHLGHRTEFLPTHHGFDEFLGLPYSGDMWPHHPEAKKGTYPPLPLIEGDRTIEPDVSPALQAQLTTRYATRAVDFIARNRERPFFFYLAPNMPHVPLFVSDKFKGKSGAGLYGDVIQEIDWAVGEVLGALKRHRLEENTLVIFASDNGPWLSYGEHAGSSGPFREGKGTAWEGGTRVPCIMRWPGHIAAGTRSDAMLMTIDLLPTIAAQFGATPPALPIDGRDVWPLLRGDAGARNPHDAYFTWYRENELQAVTTADGQWKLILPHAFNSLAGQAGGRNGLPVKYAPQKIAAPELYAFRDDPGETQNVAAAHPDVVQRLLALAERARDELGDSLTQRKGRGNREPGRVAVVPAP